MGYMAYSGLIFIVIYKLTIICARDIGGIIMSEENTQVEETEVTETEEKIDTFTQSEVDSRISKAVDSALKKQEAKLQSDIEKRIAEEREEAEKLAKLSEKERKDAELTKREQEIADRLANLEHKELKADAVADLNSKELPSEFADFLISNDAESTLENINRFKQAFDDAVNLKVKESLRQETPSVGNKELENDPFKKLISKYK